MFKKDFLGKLQSQIMNEVLRFEKDFEKKILRISG